MEKEELEKEIAEMENYQKEYHNLLGKNYKRIEMAKVSLKCIEAGNKLPILKAKLQQHLEDLKMFEEEQKRNVGELKRELSNLNNYIAIFKIIDKIFNSPSQQTSVDKREVVHTKKTSDVGENPISDTLSKKGLGRSYGY